MRSVTRSASLITAVALAVGPAAAAPAAADPVGDLIGTVTGQHDGHHRHHAYRSRSDYGRTSAPDGVLRAGCHRYRYRYVVTPPTHDWTLETFLVDRTGQGVASGIFSSDSDPARHRTHFTFCRNSTHPGRFTIRAKLHWYGQSGRGHLVRLVPSHFRLRRR